MSGLKISEFQKPGGSNGTSNTQTYRSITLPDTGIHAFYSSSPFKANRLLQAVAGVVRIPGWEIQFNGDSLQSKKNFLATYKRGMAYIGERPCLLPHITLEQNLDFAIKRSRKKKHRPAARPFEKQRLLDSFLLHRKTSDLASQLAPLSAHLTALARACLSQPRALVLANPTSQLTGQDLLQYSVAVKQVAEQIPVYWSSHDLLTIAALADTVTQVDDDFCSQSAYEFFNHQNQDKNTLLPFNLLKVEPSDSPNSEQCVQFQLSDRSLRIAKAQWLQPRTDRWLIPHQHISLNQHGQDSTLITLAGHFFSQQPINQHEQLIALQLDDQFLNTVIHNESLKLVPFKQGERVYAQIHMGPLFGDHIK